MPECDRCGPVHDDSPIMKEAADGTYCLSCYDWLEENADKDVDQHSLGDYNDR